MAGCPAQTWQSADYSYQTDLTFNQQCSRTQVQVPYAPQSGLSERDSRTLPSTIYSPHFNRPSGFVPINPSFEPPASDIDWQVSGFNSQTDLTRNENHARAAFMAPYHGPSTGRSGCLEFAHVDESEFNPNKPQSSCLLRNGASREYHESAEFRVALSPSVASTCGETMLGGPYSAACPSPSPLGWLPVADSAYGSESSQAECMMQAPHYFVCSDVENSPREHSQVPPMVATKAHRQTESETGPATTAKAFHAEQTRMRQDAHSKVEKRYRMNINSKIEQLRRIIPAEPSPEYQSANHSNVSCSSRRRKSGTDLSKRDILSMTISHVEQLQNEVQHLTSENLELKGEIASMRSLVGDEGPLGANASHRAHRSHLDIARRSR